MMNDFLESWALFHNAFLSGWLIAGLLSLVGIVVVSRGQVFIGAAVSQASTLGITIGMLLATAAPVESDPGHAHGASPIVIMAILFGIIAALASIRSTKSGRTTSEGMVGWIFLASTSMALLLLSRSPHGLDEVHHLLSSSIIGAVRSDVYLFSGMLLASVITLCCFHRTLILFMMDAAMAEAVGIDIKLMNVLIGLWMGLTIALSIRCCGMLYAFGCLVLPALIAQSLARETRTLFWLAPVIALFGAVISFVAANHYDFPPAQMTVAVLSFLFVPSKIAARLRKN